MLSDDRATDSLRVCIVTLIYLANHFMDFNFYGIIPVDYLIMGCWIALFPFIFFHNRKIYVGNRTTLLLIFFVGVMMASTLWSEFHAETFQYAIRLVLLLGFYFLILNFTSISSIERVIRNIIFIVFITSIISLYKFVFQPGLFYGRYLFYISQRGDPNFAAMTLIFCSFYAYYFARCNGKTNFKYVLLAIYFFILFIITFSRGLYVSLFLTVLLAFFPVLKGITHKFRQLILGIVFLLLGFSPLFLVLFWQKIGVVLRFDSLRDGAGRFELWLNGVRSLLKKPILGYGAGTYRYTVTLNYSTFAAGLVSHNSWLEMAFGGGIVALLAFGLFSVCLLGNLRNYEKEYHEHLLFVRITRWIFVLMLFSMFTVNLETYRNLWFVMGVAGFLDKVLGRKGRILVVR